MTITSETTKSTLYSGNGVTTAFASGFKILSNPETGEAEVEVYQLEDDVESLVSSADYTVTGADLDAGGTITFDTAPATGVDIIIKSAVSKTQDSDLRNQGASFRETYEQMVDRAVRMVQEQQEELDRTLKVTITSGEDGSSVAPEDGKVLGWDGTSLTNLAPNDGAYLSVSPFMETVLDDTTASAALTTLGVSSFAQTVLDDANAAAARTTLGLDLLTPPFFDTTIILKGSSDSTKQVRFEADGLTTATTRVVTVPDADGTIAYLASPTFTGTPAAPTAAVGTSTTQLATTAFVNAAHTVTTNSLGADVTLANTSTYYDGPSCAQGTTGTFLATGTVTVKDLGAANAVFYCKLWDGTTVIDSAVVTASVSNSGVPCTLSGVLASPAANIKISVRDTSNTNGRIVFNDSGNSKDSTLTVVRIA